MADAGLQIPAAKWNTNADDWFVGETYQFIKWDATAGHSDPIGPLTDEDGKTAERHARQLDQPEVASTAATTRFEGLEVGHDLETRSRHEPSRGCAGAGRRAGSKRLRNTTTR